MNTKTAALLRGMAVGLTICLTACGGGKNPDKPSSGAEPSTKEGRITLDEGAERHGTDANSNGIRDDIDSLIDKSGETPARQAALRQLAVALHQAVTIDVSQAVALRLTAGQVNFATACVWDRFDASQAPTQVTRMEAITANTEERFRAYEAYNRAVSGMSFSLPKGNGCAQ